MSKKIIFTVFSAVLIGLLGLYIYTSTLLLNTKRIEAANQYFQYFNENNKVSYLLESNLLSPTKIKGKLLIEELLYNSDYQTAEFVNMFVNYDDFSIKAAEAALENRDFEVAQEYIADIPDKNIQNELNEFVKFSENTDIPVNIPESPLTNIGKELNMIASQNFSLFTIDSEIGREISKILTTQPNKRELNIAVSKIYLDYGFSSFPLSILKQNTDCLTVENIIRAETLEGQGDYNKALEEVDKAIKCDITNAFYYEKAIYYSRLSENKVKTRLYEDRLLYLKNIAK